jgi:DNA-directed RNA polymerase subunit L
MAKYNRIILLLMCGLLSLGLVGCNNEYINIVKETTFKGETHTIGQLIESVAGKNGKVKWVIVKNKQKPNMVSMKVTIRPSNKANRHVVKMKYMLNADNDHVELENMEVDGKTLSLVAGALQISKIIKQSSRP